MIIFSDVDGTLLDDRKRLLDSTKEAIQELQKKDISFVIVSARSPSGIYPILKENDFNCYIISYSGGLILDEKRKTLYSKGMPATIAAEVIAYIENEKMDCSWNVYSNDRWLVKDKADPRVRNEERIVHALASQGGLASLQAGEVVHKILCMCQPGKILEIEAALKERFPGLSIAKSSDVLLEIMESGVTKGIAVEELCRILGEPVGECIAFGDNFNDMEMLQTVGVPVLMGNAPAEMKAQFACQTEDNNHDGIACALRRMHILP